MILLSSEAEAQLDALICYYEDKDRLEAAEKLLTALENVKARIMRSPAAGLPAPRPYPFLARRGLRWILEGSYWIAYNKTIPPVIVGVFYAAADIPGRV